VATLTRRSLLVALVVSGVGTTAAVLSGVFTRAAAARQLTFAVPPRQGVRLDPLPPSEVEAPTAPITDAATEDAEGQQLQVDLDLLAGELGGLNQNALTTFNPIIQLRNGSTVAVTSVEVQASVNGTDRPDAHAQAIALQLGQGWVTVANDREVSLRDETMPILPGDRALLAMRVDLRTSTISELDPSVNYHFTLTTGTDRL
jgi:hypothetical protein